MSRPRQLGTHSRVDLDQLAVLITEAIGQLEPVYVEGQLRDWHVSNTIGRGQLVTNDTRLQVVVMAWKQHHHIGKGHRVKVVGNVEWSPRFGLQLVAQTSIKPLGVDDATQARCNLYQQLANTTTAQHQLSIPADLKTVLLVGPKNGSAAVRDAQSVLGPLGLRVLVTRIAMAGPKVPTDLTLAITKHPDVDLVLVIRGGGAASDLSAFDSLKLIEAVAAHPVPIIAGIGHATNSTAFDLAVWKSAPTPSLAAQAVVDLAGQTTPAETPTTAPTQVHRQAPGRLRPVATTTPEPTPLQRRIRRDLIAAAIAVAVVLIAINAVF